VGALPPSPEQRDKAAPLGKGVKPPRRAGYCRELETTGGLSCRGNKPPFTNPSFRQSGDLCRPYKVPALAIIQSPADQGLALRSHFEALIAACELSGPRGKLKNRINTFLNNQLCRGVDELCTKQLESRDALFTKLTAMKEDVDSSHSQIEVLKKEKAAAVALSKDLQRQNNRLEWLQSYIEEDVRTHKSVREQHEGVLMHYNELQLRSAEVEAMEMNFQKRVADEVAKAGFRQKPGPKKGSIKKHVPKISRRGKTNHSDWNAQEISVESPTSEMAPPWKLKKDDKDNLSTAMQLQIATS
jgi:hypothetical protein